MSSIVSPKYRKRTENWLPSPVNGREFLVSDQGNVLRLIWDDNQVIGAVTPPLLKGAYFLVFISVRNRSYPVHRLVLEAFMGAPPNKGYQANHKNGDKHDNRLENLEWVTPSQNRRHAIDHLGVKPHWRKSRLTKEKVRAIREMLIEGRSYSEIAGAVKVDTSTVVSIHRNKTYVRY